MPRYRIFSNSAISGRTGNDVDKMVKKEPRTYLLVAMIVNTMIPASVGMEMKGLIEVNKNIFCD